MRGFSIPVFAWPLVTGLHWAAFWWKKLISHIFAHNSWASLSLAAYLNLIKMWHLMLKQSTSFKRIGSNYIYLILEPKTLSTFTAKTEKSSFSYHVIFLKSFSILSTAVQHTTSLWLNNITATKSVPDTHVTVVLLLDGHVCWEPLSLLKYRINQNC